jgi:MYXO-CTERM domain-containing protein
MPRAISPAALWAGAALGLVLGLAAPAAGQTSVIYNSNGFESPTYSTGNLSGQQGFNALPTPSAGIVQGGTAFAGSQAFQFVGQNMQQNPSYTHQNFWYQQFSSSGGFKPIAEGKPFVQVQFKIYTPGALNPQDIPFAGIHMEAYSDHVLGLTQALAPIQVSALGEVMVMTNTTTSSSNTLKTAQGLIPRDQWNSIFAELNFSTQTFRVYKNGETTPIEFLKPSGGTITEIPFRNSFGNSTTFYELGMIASYTLNLDGTPTTIPPLNNVFIDDVMFTATATSMAPVPEPGLVLAVGAAGLAGWRVYRRRKAAVA